MFTGGFEKVAAINWGSVGRMATSALKNPTTIRNAAIGAGVGAIGGAMSNKDDRLGGALKGALGGGLMAGGATAGQRMYNMNKRLGGSFGQNLSKRVSQSSFNTYHMHGQGD